MSGYIGKGTPTLALEATSFNALTDATIAESDPLITSNKSAGHIWVNKTSGETYVCTEATIDENFWVNIGDGSGAVSPYLIATAYASDGTTEISPIADGPNHHIIVFKSNGYLDVDAVGIVAPEYLVQAGGGGGGYRSGGGGGAGGLRQGTFSNLTVGNHTITVGSGGAGATTYVSSNTAYNGVKGGASSIGSLITTTGGGGAGGTNTSGSTGGCGGGGGNNNLGGSGNEGSYTPVEGYGGGQGGPAGQGWVTGGGGGGGTGEAGENATSAHAGNGGDGATSTILTTTIATAQSVGEVSGSSVYYGGGAAGAKYNQPSGHGEGGLGGGGGTSSYDGYTNSAGGVNTGGGGAGTKYTQVAGAGGSGVVIIRYKSS